MKKICSITAFISLSPLLHAQQTDERTQEILRQDYLRMLPTLAILTIIMLVFLRFTKYILDHRLKQNLIDKGVPDKMIEFFLKPDGPGAKDEAMKWFIILGCVGFGLFAVNQTLPFGIHSLAIMVTSIAVGFLVYFLVLRRNGKN